MNIRTFNYKAVDATGRTQTGQVRAVEEQEAFRKISATGLTPLAISAIMQRPALLQRSTITRADIAHLTRELCVLIEANIPLDRGLLSIAEHNDHPALTRMIRDIAAKVQSGLPMTTALEDHRRHFGDVYIETIRAAERSGNLEGVMSHLAEMLDNQIETVQSLKRAMAYPLILLSVVSTAIGVIVVFVVPKFDRIFQDKDIRLPLSTQIIQAIGHSANEYWWAYLASFAAAFIFLASAWRSTTGRVFIERIMLRIPYISKVLITVTAARFARVVGIGLTSGLDVIDSIEIGGRSTGRPIFNSECAAMAARLRGGHRLSEVMASSAYLPHFAKRMLAAGKDAKELSKSCDVISRHYDRESKHLLKNINTVIEPVLTIVIAAVVLLVALSVFLPMWEMVKIRR